MKQEDLQKIITWIKGTDLIEVSYKDGKTGFCFATEKTSSSAPHYFPGPQLSPVTAQSVGIFQWNDAGKPRRASEGSTVAAGEVLGIVELGMKKTCPVTATVAGRLRQVCIDAGQSVQYGQPLFFIEPK